MAAIENIRILERCEISHGEENLEIAYLMVRENE